MNKILKFLSRAFSIVMTVSVVLSCATVSVYGDITAGGSLSGNYLTWFTGYDDAAKTYANIRLDVDGSNNGTLVVTETDFTIARTSDFVGFWRLVYLGIDLTDPAYTVAFEEPMATAISALANSSGFTNYTFDFSGCTITYAPTGGGGSDDFQSYTFTADDTREEFNGTFTGGTDGFIFQNIHMDDGANSDRLGLFPTVGTNGTIKNIGIANESDKQIKTAQYVGAIAGINKGTIDNCFFATENIDESNYLSARTAAGGIAGKNEGTIKNCFNNSGVHSWNSNTMDVSGAAGGIAGLNSGTVTNCYNVGVVSGSGYVGGIVGNNSNTVTNSYSAGIFNVDYYPYKVEGVAGGTRGSSTSTYFANDVGFANGDDATRMTAADMTANKMTGLGSAFASATGTLPYIISNNNLTYFKDYVSTSIATPLEVIGREIASENKVVCYAGGVGASAINAYLTEDKGHVGWFFVEGDLPNETYTPYAGGTTTMKFVPDTPGAFTGQYMTIGATAAKEQILWEITVYVSGIVPQELKDALVGQTYEHKIEHTMPTENNTWSVTSGTLPTGIVLEQTGYLSGTPTTAVNNHSFTITAVNNDDTNISSEIDLTLTVKPSTASDLEILTTFIPDGVKGSSYNTTIKAAGTGVKFSLAPGAPDWLSISSSGGVLSSSSLTSSGTYEITVIIENADYNCARTYLFKVAEAAVEPKITSVILPHGVSGKSYSYTLSTQGTAPITFVLTSGTLPTGLSLNQSTGVISGTPTGFASYPFTITASNTAGSTATLLNITIKLKGTAVEIELPDDGTASLPDGREEGYYLYQIPVSSYSGVTFEVTSGGLPLGLQMDKNGIISGTVKKASADTYTFGVKVTDKSNNTDTKECKIVIAAKSAQVDPPAFATSSGGLPDGVTKREYVGVIKADGTGPFYFEMTGGTLPTGLDFSPKGEISGIPSEAGGFSITVEVSSEYSNVTASQSFDLIITEWVSKEDYPLTTPHGGTVTSGDDLILPIDRDFEEFRKLFLDGDPLTFPNDFTGVEGSTVVTIMSKTIKNKTGSYEVVAEFDDGLYTQSFNNVAAPDSGSNNTNTNAGGGGGAAVLATTAPEKKPKPTEKPEETEQVETDDSDESDNRGDSDDNPTDNAIPDSTTSSDNGWSDNSGNTADNNEGANNENANVGNAPDITNTPDNNNSDSNADSTAVTTASNETISTTSKGDNSDKHQQSSTNVLPLALGITAAVLLLGGGGLAAHITIKKRKLKK